MALKNYNFIEKHLEQIYEDQFDFHLYSMRKFTFKSYDDMIKMEDDLYKNPYAIKSAIGIIKVLSKLSKIKE